MRQEGYAARVQDARAGQPNIETNRQRASGAHFCRRELERQHRQTIDFNGRSPKRAHYSLTTIAAQ